MGLGAYDVPSLKALPKPPQPLNLRRVCICFSVARSPLSSNCFASSIALILASIRASTDVGAWSLPRSEWLLWVFFFSVMASESRGRTILLTASLVLSPSLSVPLPACCSLSLPVSVPLDNPCPCRLPLADNPSERSASVLCNPCSLFLLLSIRSSNKPSSFDCCEFTAFFSFFLRAGRLFLMRSCAISASCSTSVSLVTVSAVASASILFLSKFATSNCCTSSYGVMSASSPFSATSGKSLAPL